MSFSVEDLRAAVAAGILSEAQAASVTALANDRAGKRAGLPAEDEPFEFFRGFSEIFISIGLFILLVSIVFLMMFMGSGILLSAVPLLTAIVAWWLAGYFTLRRRMTLPSMLLATAFGVGLLSCVFTLLAPEFADRRVVAILGFGLATLGMIGWYLRFRLPFAAFLTGFSALGLIYSVTATAENMAGVVANGMFGDTGIESFFDLAESPVFATATLLFGVGAFLVGMWFDTRDPYRLGRHSATAFWCHLLAAPALVNTVAITLMNGAGTWLLAVALVFVTLLALVIDRRSFLTAAIIYFAIVISWMMGEGRGITPILVLLVLGSFIVAIGTWWIQLRAAIMRTLPDFPGKSRLPPYESTE
jgi:hypothetical protein